MSVTGLVVVLAVLAVATVVGLVLRARSGRVVPTTGRVAPGWNLVGVEPAADDRVLLLQLSSPICTPCRQTAVQLTELSGTRDGLRHVEVDIAERPEIARTLDVMRTPTTVAFARDGRELLRVSGVPRRQELLEALDSELTSAR
ncbi:thioredoxin family protein [Actinomycetospora corticicola]|uniref:Thiol-disulfide isomerase/thioredoxin n=1 Tax=Actinomycetospora corticicola TaxID=663602 RepID=A0A7Y9E0L0_9PSEU|nr:thioredoxin family protein [Actinomycetospora corticicola]NYD38717.1 thiol-disulfide isomerase/thioredoxin [Actinomycetospora corticicola]